MSDRTPDEIAADFAAIQWPDHEAKILAMEYLKLRGDGALQWLRDDIAVKVETIAALERERDALREAVLRARGILQPWDGSYPSRTAAMEALNVLIDALAAVPNPVEAEQPKGVERGKLSDLLRGTE